ncbi:MAG TPA: 50S ribosomal protein L17 [Thermotogota bacterium]|nr:50S ribosomal protein L17 [Thermotogota bacterium]HRW91347.1 50S ribosomal protein L17 [Thermotogota bacterium]
MRHRNKVNRLGRASDHRKALIRNMTRDVLTHGSIVTTLPKAKAVRPFVEKIITRAKKGDVPARRYINRFLHDSRLTNKVVEEVAKDFQARPGGYTRILKLGKRRGDAAEMAIFQLVKND